MHAKSLQSCPTLCDPMDCNLPGSSIHGILQARPLEWVAMPPPGDLPNPGIKPESPVAPALKVDSLPLSPDWTRTGHLIPPGHSGSLWGIWTRTVESQRENQAESRLLLHPGLTGSCQGLLPSLGSSVRGLGLCSQRGLSKTVARSWPVLWSRGSSCGVHLRSLIWKKEAPSAGRCW